MLASCKLDEKEFYKRVFRCDTAAPDPACGADLDGKPLGCFAARQIGATDFCTRTCTPAGDDDKQIPIDPNGQWMSVPPPGPVCMSSGLELARCNPANDGRPEYPDGACGQRSLGCLRTDLVAQQGVCTTLATCSTDVSCRDPVRSVCASSFVASLYKNAPSLRRDHLFCMQTGCRARGTSCSPGETCLQAVIPPEAKPPDICVPNCDSNLRCPPNFLCYRKISTPLAPAVCIPGLLGFTCESSIDCLIGTCTNTGLGYNVCTLGCAGDADCSQYDSEQGKFVCIKNQAKPDEPGSCQSPDSYRGTVCAADGDCQVRNPKEICHRFEPGSPTGNCLEPCDAEGRCPARGGIGHTCLPPFEQGRPPICFPGYFGFPCRGDDQCVGDLRCRPTLPNQPNVCTAACATSADCAANRWIEDGWCVPGLQICLARAKTGDACVTDDGCVSRKCGVPTSTLTAEADAGAPSAAASKECLPADGE